MKNKFSELHKQFKRNREIFSLLSKLIKELKDKTFFAVFGGFAIDAYHGEQTRFHEDVDMICWRKDIETVQKALKSVGCDSEIISHHKETELEYIIKTTDKYKTFSFQIADPVDDQSFEISFWPYTHLKFPNSYLDIKWKELEGVRFPVVAKQILIGLKKKHIELCEKTKKENEEKYLFKQKQKHLKALHDLQLLTK